MGLALGGIAAPLPRLVYGVMGDATSLSLSTGSFGVNDSLLIDCFWLPDNNGDSVTLTINDGANHTYVLSTGATASRKQHFTFHIKNGFQIGNFTEQSVGGTSGTDAISMANITTISLSGVAGTTKLRSLMVIACSTP